MDKKLVDSYELYQDDKVYVITPLSLTHDQRVIGVDEKVDMALKIALKKLETKSMKVAFSLQRNDVYRWTKRQLQYIIDFCLKNQDRATIVPDFTQGLEETIIHLVERSKMFREFLEGIGMNLKNMPVQQKFEKSEPLHKMTGSPVDKEGVQVDGLVLENEDILVVDKSMCVFDEEKRYKFEIRECKNGVV